MSRLRRLGLRSRLAVALAGIAVASVALATLLSNSGLSGRLDDSARHRLESSVGHIAQLAAEVYASEGGWTAAARRELVHLAAVDGLRIEIDPDRKAGPFVAEAPVVVDGRTVARLQVTPADPVAFREGDRDLHRRVNRLHLLAGVLAAVLGVIAAVLLAIPLARPLQRLTAGARRMEQGDLSVRVEPEGGAEVEHLAHALNRLAGTLAREEELRREATEDLAHELRTPLTGIISRIEAAQDGVLPDEASNLEAMQAEALRLKQLVADLGRLAEAQEAALLLRRSQVDLGRVAEARAGVRAPGFADKGIEFDVETAAVTISGDEERLAQVVDNLLSNALRYTDSGGRVTLRVAAEEEDAVLEVGDTGIGLSADELPHVFDRFWRSDKSRARSSGGAGIGLAIVHELVRAHDGRINVSSRPAAGSTFTVRFPLVRHASTR